MDDPIDRILEQWRRERPDLDLSAIGVFGRLSQLNRRIEAAVEEVLTRHGLRQGEFDVLTALRRAGDPYILTPSELSDLMMMSRAGMTNRVDRLESAGLVERSLDPTDRRSFRIKLTKRGLDLIDATLTDHADNLALLSALLSEEDTKTLDRILRAALAAR